MLVGAPLHVLLFLFAFVISSLHACYCSSSHLLLLF
jgi:uncharacterized membrane protein YqaE (UPF0057 family)